ncbi:MAG: LamG domain-containing protein [Minisyncoccota bacterium]
MPARHERPVGATISTRGGGVFSVLSVIILVALATLALLPTTPVRAATTINSTLSMPPNNLGLVGWWTFDGAQMVSNVADSSGQGNNGNLRGGATTTTPGPVGQALSFNGTSQYVTIPQFNNSGTNVLSVSFWLYQSSFTSTDSLAIEATANNNLNATGLMIDPNSSAPCLGEIQISVHGNVGYNDACYTRPSAGRWHHYVFIGDKGQAVEVNLYIDGVLQTPTIRTNTNDNTNNFGNDPWYFMSRGGTTLFNAGKLDDVRIFNRALSASEVTQMYNAGSGSHVNVSLNPPNLANGLVGWWTFDGNNMLQNVADTSGQGNNGNLIGYTSTTTTPGPVGQALSFNGSNQYVSITENGTTMDMPQGTGASVSVWFKTTGLYGPIFGGRTTGSTDGTVFSVYLGHNGAATNAGFIEALVRDSSDSANYVSLQSSAVVNDGKWHLATLVRNGTNAYLYVDGVQNSTGSNTINGQLYLNYSAIGADRNWISSNFAVGKQYFPGTIDDVRIYNRALSAQEVKQLYNLSRTTLKALWR